MSEEKRKVYNKTQPSAEGRTFTPIPSTVRHYVHHPEIKPGMLYLYALIIDYYNVEQGYAFPSVDQLALDYGMSYNATSKHIEVLRDVGLIDYPEKGKYVPLEPLGASEFYDEFPEAWVKYTQAHKASDNKRQKDRERMRKWRIDNGYDS